MSVPEGARASDCTCSELADRIRLLCGCMPLRLGTAPWNANELYHAATAQHAIVLIGYLDASWMACAFLKPGNRMNVDEWQEDVVTVK
eukprot:6183652-Pleurochrysis_carterae.AAC.1